MKKIFVLSAIILGLSACSSTEKKEMENEANEAVKTETKKMEDKAKDAKSDAETATASKTSCTLDQDTRVIEVKKTDAGGCELFYTKFGEAKSVASSGFGSQYCEEVKDRIQTNLNKAGFTCQ